MTAAAPHALCVEAQATIRQERRDLREDFDWDGIAATIDRTCRVTEREARIAELEQACHDVIESVRYNAEQRKKNGTEFHGCCFGIKAWVSIRRAMGQLPDWTSPLTEAQTKLTEREALLAECRESLQNARSTIWNAVEANLHLPGSSPKTHHRIIEIDKLLARLDSRPATR